jgi:hypothetical protein
MPHRLKRAKANTETLASLVAAHAPYDGIFPLRIPSVHAIRISRPHRLQSAVHREGGDVDEPRALSEGSAASGGGSQRARR